MGAVDLAVQGSDATEEVCRRRQFSTWTRCSCAACRASRSRTDKLRRNGKTPTREAARMQREAARRILISLRAEKWSPSAIADAYGIPAKTMHRISYTLASGSMQLPGMGLARAILAGPVRRPTSGHVPSWPVTRRLRALGAIGWTNAEMRVRLGFAQSVVSDAQAGRRALVSARFDAAVRVLYAELENTPGPSLIAARAARAKGWGAPAAWDDIDNRPEQPKGVGRAVSS
jgi:hypothetical protein